MHIIGVVLAYPFVSYACYNSYFFRERYKKQSWQTPIEDKDKLTEDDITKFVESMKPVIFVSMFSKYGSQDSAIALRHLSNLRPELVVPDLLERSVSLLISLKYKYDLTVKYAFY